MSVIVTCKFDEDLIHSSWEYLYYQRTTGPIITHLSAEDMLKSAVIEEMKFKHSPRIGADNPSEPNILCQQEGLITMVIYFKKNLFNLRLYTLIFMI